MNLAKKNQFVIGILGLLSAIRVMDIFTSKKRDRKRMSPFKCGMIIRGAMTILGPYLLRPTRFRRNNTYTGPLKGSVLHHFRWPPQSSAQVCGDFCNC